MSLHMSVLKTDIMGDSQDQIGQPVRVKAQPQKPESNWLPGQVVDVSAPRSYIVQVNGRQYRRNRIHLRDSHTDKPVINPVTPGIQTTPRESAVPTSPSVNRSPAVRNTPVPNTPVSVRSSPTTAVPSNSNVRTTRYGRPIIAPRRFQVWCPYICQCWRLTSWVMCWQPLPILWQRTESEIRLDQT